MSKYATYKAVITGPKWACLLEAIEEYAFLNYLENNSYEKKGLFNTKVYVDLRGEVKGIVEAEKMIRKSIEDYND